MRFGILLMLVLSLAACRSELETVETKNDEGYLTKYTRMKTNYAKEGMYTVYYPSGKVYETANYVNDTLHGERKIYFENEQVEILETYDRGFFTSPYLKYFENGQVQLEGHYEDNKATGEWKRYYKNGTLREIVSLRDNDEYGPFTEYYENGKLKTEGTYEGVDPDTGYPREHGLLKMYNEQGELMKKMDCDFGRCNTIWTKEEGDKED